MSLLLLLNGVPPVTKTASDTLSGYIVEDIILGLTENSRLFLVKDQA
jgi:hypothetical protein